MTSNKLLDLDDGVGQVASTYRYTLLIDGDDGGELHPSGKSTIQWDTSALTMRTIDDFTLPASEAADVNVLKDEVFVEQVLEDDTSYALGVFDWVNVLDDDGPLATPQKGTLHDRTMLLDVPLFDTFSVDTGGNLTNAIERLVQLRSVTNYELEPSEKTTSDPVLFQAGTSAATAINDLCRLAGFLPAYFDSSGLLVLRTAPPIAQGDFTVGDPAGYHVYTLDNSRIVRGTPKDSQSLLLVPNGHLVVGSGPSGATVSAVAWVDPQAPHSKENTGRERVITHRMQGIGDVAAALAAANSFANTSPLDYRTIEFTSAPDGRHDAFHLVEYGGDEGTDGVVYLETKWSLELTPGGRHTHSISRGGAP